MLPKNQFESFYNQQLAMLKFAEEKDQDKTFITRKRWYGLRKPQRIGEVIEMPQMSNGKVIGSLRLLAYDLKTPLWDIIINVGEEFNVVTDIQFKLDWEEK